VAKVRIRPPEVAEVGPYSGRSGPEDTNRLR
jgi:hypothetical protein